MQCPLFVYTSNHKFELHNLVKIPQYNILQRCEPSSDSQVVSYRQA